MENIAPIPTDDSPPRRRPIADFFGRRFLTFAELVEIGLATNRPQLSAAIKAGRFPPPIYLNQRQPRWDVTEIQETLDRLKANREADHEKAGRGLAFLAASRARARSRKAGLASAEAEAPQP
jgi:predicted DNA-binding transcriptional regulator AlpA